MLLGDEYKVGKQMLRLEMKPPGPAMAFGALLIGGGLYLIFAIGQSVVEDHEVIGSELVAALLIAAPFLAAIWFGAGLIAYCHVVEFDASQLSIRYRERRIFNWKRGELQLGAGQQFAVRPEFAKAPIFGPVTGYRIVLLHHSVPMGQLPVRLRREHAMQLIDALWSAGCLANENPATSVHA